MSAEDTRAFLALPYRLNRSDVSDHFSRTLGEGARYYETRVLEIIGVVALSALLAGGFSSVLCGARI